MTKKEMIEAIEHAKNLHLKQMKKIGAAIDGKKIDDPTAIGKMECACGIWFHGNEKELKHVLGLQLFEHLDSDHERWHRVYLNIHTLLFKEEKKGLFSKLVGSKEDPLLQDKRKLYYAELQKETKALLLTADAALRRVSALQDSKFS